MVKVAFICEDDAGKKIIDSDAFRKLIYQQNIEITPPVFNARGKGNLTDTRVSGLIKAAIENGAEHIFLLTDMDLDACITKTKEQIVQHKLTTVIVSKKAVEAWFLADTDSLSALLRENAYYEFPEEPVSPYEIVNQLHKRAREGRGISKAILPIKMLGNGFSLSTAAKHPNCASVKYFVNKLETTGRSNT